MINLPEFHNSQFSRRRFLQWGGAAAALGLAPAAIGQDKKKAASNVNYNFVNKTNGRWKDSEMFWSMNDGREWHSFDKEPTVPCPGGNGRVYFYAGKVPADFYDRETYWDFIEYAANGNTWNGNTTQVDAFCLPITIEMAGKKVGIASGRTKLFEDFKKNCPEEFKGCVKGDYWILSPNKAGFDAAGPHGKYFDKYVDEVWEMYAKEKPTPSEKFVGKVTDGALTFTASGGGKAAFTCKAKPSTQDIFLGEHELAKNAQFCAAFNRHVAADPGDWRDASKFYQGLPCNWYSKFLHEHTVDKRCYGFCYDDVSEQAAFFSAKGDNLIVTFYWD